MPTLASYPAMMQRDRKREGLRICRAAWLVGVSVREYQEIEAGDRWPSFDTFDRLAGRLYYPSRWAQSPTSPPNDVWHRRVAGSRLLPGDKPFREPSEARD